MVCGDADPHSMMLEGLDVFRHLESDTHIIDEERKAEAAAEKPMSGEEVVPRKPDGAEPAKTPAKTPDKSNPSPPGPPSPIPPKP